MEMFDKLNINELAEPVKKLEDKWKRNRIDSFKICLCFLLKIFLFSGACIFKS